METKNERIELAKKFRLPEWKGGLLHVNLGVRSDTWKTFGYKAEDFDRVSASHPDGKGQITGYVSNPYMPDPIDLEECKVLSKMLLPKSADDLVAVCKSLLQTTFRNKARAILNTIELQSKQAIKDAKAADLDRQFKAGEITAEQAFEEMRKLVAK